MKLYNTSVFIFRRDYRINDNTGLIKSLLYSKRVIPIFIFTPEQIDDKKNIFKSNNAAQFMIESLVDLNRQLKKKQTHLYMFYGDYIFILNNLLKQIKFDCIFFNKDYTPYSLERDSKIKKFCQDNGLVLHTVDDICLHPIGSVLTLKKDGYKKFSLYYKKAKNLPVSYPQVNNLTNYYNDKLKYELKKNDLLKLFKVNNNIKLHGGRSKAKLILDNIHKHIYYNDIKDEPLYETSLLSPYIRFGNISVREVYYSIINKLGKRNKLIEQLYWRDFYINFGYYNLELYTQNFIDHKFSYIKYDDNPLLFKLWTEGNTGFPLCDAGMRELNKTGYMHSRVRMLTATVLCRILLLDWRLGEKYFSIKLIDHDRALNEGNWMWIAGTSPHSQEYFRIMTPKSQTIKFDPECIYIKKWIPELKNVENKDIINWDTKHKKYLYTDYPSPVVSYKKNKLESIKRYKESIDK